VKLQTIVARYWLKELVRDDTGGGLWQLTASRPAPQPTGEGVFYGKLLASMHDAVVFVDSTLKIVLWNRAAERLTGIATASIEHKRWSPTLIGLRDEQGKTLGDDNCPVSTAMQSGVQTVRRLSVAGRSGQRLEVDAHLVPVHGKSGAAHGAALLMHDASSQITLEQRIQCLHEKATRDPLTQVANRAEFDRILANYVESHLERRIPCSLILCDLDYFKRVNDTYGHQAGDEVLITFAALLRRHCRSGDLVARYGGEEFVLLCADCDNATATRRAEELRQEIAELPLAALEGRSVSASFGVTEVQAGDTPETMLRRADRALYQAKSSGRNTVVQLGAGSGDPEAAPKRTSWLSWLLGTAPDQVLERTLATSVPFNVVVEKMRGFVADHHAQIDSVTENYLVLKIEGGQDMLRRSADRPVPFVIEMRFDESSSPGKSGIPGQVVRTIIHVTIRPIRSRDRRRDMRERSQRLLASLKCYLIAQEHTPAAKSPTQLTQAGVEKDRLQEAAKRWTQG
jgi:diguanylate cyclase (GGDEF)-like protein/PAS domain S-box-containing protein